MPFAFLFPSIYQVTKKKRLIHPLHASTKMNIRSSKGMFGVSTCLKHEDELFPPPTLTP